MRIRTNATNVTLAIVLAIGINAILWQTWLTRNPLKALQQNAMMQDLELAKHDSTMRQIDLVIVNQDTIKTAMGRLETKGDSIIMYLHWLRPRVDSLMWVWHEPPPPDALAPRR